MTAVAEELHLDLTGIVEPHYDPHLSIDEQFALFHALNPRVADAVEALASQWLSRHPKVGVKAIFERLRWESGIQTVGEPWRLNNNFTSRYARLLLARRPEWAGRIEVRSLASERVAS